MLGSIQLKRKRNGRRGAVIVELAISFVLLLTLLFGLIQFGMILHMAQSVQEYAREGARYVAMHHLDTSPYAFSDSSTSHAPGFAWAMSQMATAHNLTSGSFTYQLYQGSSATPSTLTAMPSTDCPQQADCQTGQTVTLAVTYNMAQSYLISPFIPRLPSNSYTCYCAVVLE